MRKIFLFLIVLFCSLSMNANAQNEIPNPGFEQWVGNTASGWYLNNPGFGSDCLTKSTDAYSGQFALRGEVINIAGFPYPPAFWAGNITTQVFPLTHRPDSLTGYYKFFPAGPDTLLLTVVLFFTGPDTVIERHELVANTQSSYKKFAFYYPNIPNKPWQASFHGVIRTAGALPTVGTYFLLDHLAFDNNSVSINPISLEVPDSYNLKQNYPNPFNPSTNIEFSIPKQEFVKLTVYNMLGEEVEILVNNALSPGIYRFNWNAANLPGGTYFYKFNSGNFSTVRKMILIK